MKRKNIKYCHIPSQVDPEEAKAYSLLLKAHCDADDKHSDKHECQGVISISTKSLVLRCKKCGDAKGTIKP